VPGDAGLTGDVGAAELAMLERFVDPAVLARAGARRLPALIARASRNHLGAERASE
jgi:hypothetical protein